MPRDDSPAEARGAILLWRAAAVVWAIILAIICIRLKKHAADPGSIPRLFYEAGTHWLSAQPLYAQEGAYRYSPGVAAILSLFVRLPVWGAALCWLAISIVSFFAGFFYWLRAALPDPRDGRTRALIVLLATPLILGNFNNVQANPVCLGAMLATAAAALRKKWLIAAVCIAAATSLKVYPLAIGLVLLVLYPRRLWLAMLVGLALAAVLPFLLGDPHYVLGCYHDWIFSVLHDERSGRDPAVSYRDVALVWRVYAGHFNLLAYQILQLTGAMAIGGCALLLWRSRKPDAVKVHLLLGLVLCWIMLLGPSTESATYMMLGPLAAWLLLDSWCRRRAIWIRIFATAAYAILLITDIIATTPFGRRFITLGVQPLAALFALIALIGWYFQVPAGD